MSHPHAELLDRFYTAFQQGDAETMAACYHPQVTFKDPVFELRGHHAGNMWRMLVGSGSGSLEIFYRNVQADEQSGRVQWEAKYPFSRAKRQVHNKIQAEFAFREGLIVRHTDRFNLWKWSRMALGPMGLVLGWTPYLQNKIRAQALKQLGRFEESLPQPE
ncbi:MAG: nuclear transport factor 2 family protein [Bacteroidota bacterium]